MTAFEALHWIDQHASYCLIQQLPALRRQKNKVLLEFRLPDGQRAACGGRNLYDAVQRAAARIQTFQTRNDLSIPGPETRAIASAAPSEGVTA
ncbi:MAG: hypothetical protein ACRD4Q_04970 [Candidatus Acidiferrales bacterium]